MSNKKKEILLRAYLGFLAVCLLGIAIVARVFYIQTVQGAYYRGLAESMQIDTMEVVAERGNIYSADGRLMATTLPTFDIRIDFKTTYAHPDVFKDNVDSVSLLLSSMFRDKSKGEYKNELISERQKATRYYLLKRNITFNQLLEMKQWPMFREGQYKSGMLSIQNDKRLMPFGLLAQRTIGFTNTNERKVGLEGQYDDELHGKMGEVRVQKIAGGVRIPIDSKEDIAPQPGRDIYTTIDVNLQDVAEDALDSSLQNHHAGHGCVILMEVKTGKIKAIANLGITKDSITYAESFNYAVGEATEPGSTFKLATVASVMEDGLANNNTLIDVGEGVTKFYDQTVRDHEAPETPQLTLKRAVEVSSNVAMAKLAYQCYASHPEKFYKNLQTFGFTEPIDIEIPGAAKPTLAEPKKWSGVSVAYIAHGYEVEITPLHTLMFYNAIANNGKMVKPYIVDKIKEYNATVDSTQTTILNEHICSDRTIRQLRDILEGVVQNGTAKNLKNGYLTIAGKTGTAVIAQGKGGYKVKGKKLYQASFCGYFPAEDPQYSMIVVINSPSVNGYYGNVVAGAIFKDVADKVYSQTLNMNQPLNKKAVAESPVAMIQKASVSDLKNIYKFFGMSVNEVNSTWATATGDAKRITLAANEVTAGVVPDVTGMSLKDALYLLESMGLKVSITGKGSVTQQSIEPGTKILKGNTITIQLS